MPIPTLYTKWQLGDTGVVRAPTGRHELSGTVTKTQVLPKGGGL